MTTGELLVELFEAYKSKDDAAFMSTALTLIEEEKDKNHYILANKLKKIISSTSISASKGFSNHMHNVANLPRDKDKGSDLVEIIHPKKSLDDVVLTEEIRKKLDDLVTEYNKRNILNAYGLKPKTKILFCGPPGCGKTLTAEILANELDLPILYTRFDGLISSYLGETATNIRKVFEFAGKNNWVLFFDEFDAIGKSRSDVDEHGELKRVVNSFLQILDGFSSDSFVIAATNHEKNIDSALWRRFDEIIFFDKPEQEQIIQLVKNKLKSYKVNNLNVEMLSKKMQGMSYADVERVCIESIKYCLINGDIDLTSDIFENNLQKELKRAELIRKIEEE